MSTNTPLGPLPKGDRSDELQQRSLAALRALLPTERFLLRDERVDDKGVDLSLELKAESAFTNIRSQVQIKSTDSLATNSDGSYSRKVEASNLNYLLNGPSPLYVLWIEPRREFRFLWARDEARRLNDENPTWADQGTVTLRFREVLGDSSLDSIYDRILTEGRLHRETHDSLARTAATGSVSIKIDAQTLSATTSHEAFRIIESSGFGIVSAGYAAFVRDNAKLLTPAEHDQPRIRLVCGYASMSLGDYFGARADLGRSLARRMELSDTDRYFLDAILLECDQKLARIDDNQYRQRRNELEATAPKIIALQLRLHRLRFEHLYAGPDRDERLPWSQQLAAVVGEIEAETDASESLKLEARLFQLFARSLDQSAESIRTFTLLRMRREMGHPTNTPGAIEALRKENQQRSLLDQEADACVREAVRLQHPLIAAESILTRAVILIVRTTQARMIVADHGKPLAPIPDTIVHGMLGQLRSAEDQFRQAQNTEGTVRAVLLQADWLEVAGRFDEALDRAVSVEGLAIGMGYEQNIERIAAFRSGNSKQRQLLESISDSEYDDTRIALATDEDLQRCAKDCLESLDLPPERLPFVEREWQSIRGIAFEKRNWCRHLELHQNLLHTGSRLTHYRRDPDRICFCTLHKYRSKVESSDWVALIAEFKRRFCNKCRDRSPAQPSS